MSFTQECKMFSFFYKCPICKAFIYLLTPRLPQTAFHFLTLTPLTAQLYRSYKSLATAKLLEHATTTLATKGVVDT